MPDKKDPKRGLDPDKLDGTTTRRASIISLLIIIALIVYLIVNMGGSFGAPQTKSLTTSEFVAAVQDGRVDTATPSSSTTARPMSARTTSTTSCRTIPRSSSM